MGKGTSANNTSNTTSQNNGSNQVSGDGNISFSGIGGLNDVNISNTDYGSVNASIDGMTDVANKVIGTASEIVDNSFNFADKNQDFTLDILNGFQESVVSSNKNAFDLITENTNAITSALSSENLKQSESIIGLAKISVIIISIAFVGYKFVSK